MNTTKKITKTQARAEIKRRKAPRGSVERQDYPGDRRVMEMSNADLKALAVVTPRKALANA